MHAVVKRPRLLRFGLVLLAAMLLLPASARAAVLSGEVSDVRGDDGKGGQYLFDDLRSFDIVNDHDEGRLSVGIDFWDHVQKPGQSEYRFFVLNADFGRYSNNTCTVVASMYYELGDSGVEPPPTFIWNRNAAHGTTEMRYEGGSWSGMTVTFRGLMFRESDFDCVTNIRVDNDSANAFCYGAGGTIACPRTPVSSPPAAPTNLQVSVAGPAVKLTWRATRSSDFSHFAVRRGTRSNPDAGRWVRLNGSFSEFTATDDPGAGTYYYYVTQVSSAGVVSERSNVARVVVQAPPTTPKPQQPPDPESTPHKPQDGGGTPVAPSPSVGPVVMVVPGQPTVVTTPPSTRRQRTISRGQAHYQARLALRRVYKKPFKNGSRYRDTCRRNSRTKQTCRVSWRYRQYQYSGKVVVKLRDAGYRTTVDVRRRASRR